MSASPEVEVDVEAAASAAALKRKARLGIVALAARGALLQFVVLGGNVYLYRVLGPSDFGAYAIVRWVLTFFAFFGDAGLGGALIQKKDEPTRRELSSVLWLQLGLSLVLVAALGLGAPILVRFWPDMPPAGTWLLRALALDLLLTAARVIPTILMERHLQFGRLALLDVLLSIGFNGTAVFFALRGRGVMSLVYAVLVQGTLGVVGAYLLRPWRPSLVLDGKLLRPLLRFGTTFQGASILGFAIGAINPIFGGRALGQRSAGHINWAMDTAYFPINIVNLMTRVSFPLFSRLQHDRPLLTRSLEKAVRICAMGTYASVGLFLGLGPNIVHVIYTDQWMPALPLFYLYALGLTLGFLAPILLSALDASGRPQFSLRYVILSAVLVWTLVPIGAHLWGEVGFVAAFALQVAISNVVAIATVKAQIPELRLWRHLRASLLGGLALAATGHWLIAPWAWSALTFTLGAALEIGLFLAIVALLDREALREVVELVQRRAPA